MRSQKGGTNDTPFAVIIEPRKHKALSFVLRNFHGNLPGNWQILVLHSTENEAFVKDIIKGMSVPHMRIQTRSLGVPKLTYEEYNALLKEPVFYEKYIPGETFLIFQTDSMICPANKDLLNKFLEYHYVGAPWKLGGVGNGGLSLRKRSAILAKLRACAASERENEDAYFAADCDAVKLKRPSDEAAKEFSVETIYSPQSFGIHKPWAHLKPHELHSLEARCPGVNELKLLQ